MRLYIGLLHYPVYDKNHRKIASAITTTDLHDISRLARTYGVKRFYVITPLEDQQELAERVLRHWKEGFGASYNPNRKEALELASVVSSLEDAVSDIRSTEGESPLLIATDASRKEGCLLDYEKATEIIGSDRVTLLIFGTAWGLERSVIRESDYILDPVKGPTDYNHLSVRTAAGIILDRLAGRR
ncbi:MAG: RNA methyltransferase [Deltaproteobacteria bacterium]|nr:RNA methyltransferase [Deltaproteobacteria bacterium]MBW2063300.1 RNA methyltransferase [Deltaproteobacteria bacterium]